VDSGCSANGNVNDCAIDGVLRRHSWLFKALIVSMELAAGREHFTNYRDFLARQGLPGLISSHGLSVETEKVVSAGNMHAYVARK
jgi:hypothetical protein